MKNNHSENNCWKKSLPGNRIQSTLKLVSAIFYEIFIFSPNDSPSKTVKNVFYFI